MARRKQLEEHVNHERWLVSYADFITLLFAFFVVMYSVSSVNEGKYRVLSESLNAAFKQSATSLDPVQVGSVSRTAYTKYKAKNTLPIVVEFEGLPPPLQYRPEPKDKPKPEPETVTKPSEPEQPMQELRKQLEKIMSPLVNLNQVEVRGNNLELEIEIKSNVLFVSGSATLNTSATPILENLAKLIKPLANNVHVEGYTDNIPIRNSIFPSNWELSTARSASVVQKFVNYGVDPRRLAATGYAEFHPIADNSTATGRRRNRRVVLVIKASKYDAGVMEAIRSYEIPAGLRSPGSTTIMVDPIYDEIQDTKIAPVRDRVPENVQEPGARFSPSRDIDYEPLRQPVRRSAPVTTAPVVRKIPAPRRTLPGEELPVQSGSFSSNTAPESLSTQDGKPYTLSDDLKNQVAPDNQGGQTQETQQ